SLRRGTGRTPECTMTLRRVRRLACKPSHTAWYNIRRMSTELICSALGVRPDQWPPDLYALLGLPPGEVDLAAVEGRVLDRMERLRRYQLAHPDAVTDAMNRLAQALVCLTDPAAKAAYD